MIDFFGRFHPLLVHLPIGMLMLVFILKLINIKGGNQTIAQTLPLIAFIAFLSAVLSCLSGFVLFNSNDYEADIVLKHQWSGIGLTVLLGFILLLKKQKSLQQGLWVGVFILLCITGHLGGSLTHGENFLNPKAAQTAEVIENVENALVYQDIIEPIFAKNCYSCHADQKQKGKLRLDTEAFMLAGGKHKNALVPKNSLKSLIYSRLVLDQNLEEHMPPKGKPQLTSNEIKLINWWIAEGASFHNKVSEIDKTSEISTILSRFEKIEEKQSLKVVNAAEDSDIQKIRDLGAAILPISQSSNYLTINFNGSKRVNSASIKLLNEVKDQTLILNASNLVLDDSGWQTIAELENLTKLDLSHSNISDQNLSRFKYVKNLSSLNISFTNISEKGILSIQNANKLESLYLFNTKINKENWKRLQAHLPNTKIDSGGYVVPTFESDTTQIKQTKR